MADALFNLAPSARTSKVRDLAPPAWAQEWAGGKRFALLSAEVKDVRDLTPAVFEGRTRDAYASMARQLKKLKRLPVRFWNHVPFITEPADAERDNYMVFNAGRFAAFESWFGGPAAFERDVATASAIGHWGRDLVIHCLAADVPGVAVNNPRQVAPYHYSQRFGPLPPCFSRATRLQHPAGLTLVGGTASVRGEDSVHIDHLTAQLRETFVNLAALIGAAAGRKPRHATLLSAFRELRAYYPDRSHAPEIESAIRAAFPSLRRLEMLHAELCRSELLVEIEGLADLNLLADGPAT
jgi:chorismate lyase/3-hydroxybenzoate synthase